jgi:hypothetical protein
MQYINTESQVTKSKIWINKLLTSAPPWVSSSWSGINGKNIEKKQLSTIGNVSYFVERQHSNSYIQNVRSKDMLKI